MVTPIELVRKSSWERDLFDEEPNIIETCSNKHTTVVASSNHVVIYDYLKGSVSQHIQYHDSVSSASLHPSGRHVLVAFTDKLQLANILLDGIECFWEVKTHQCVDCKFNPRGSVFAAICGMTIKVYDFIHGTKLNTIDCNSATFQNLRWGDNCTIHATYDDFAVCKWDALDASKQKASFECKYSRVLGYAVAEHGNVIIASSDNTLKFLSRELKCKSSTQIDDDFVLDGAITVSNEGLVFVSMRHQSDEHKSPLVRLYSIIGEDYYDQHIEQITKVMNISHDGRFLITNNGVFQVRDRRGYSKTVITACFDNSDDDYVTEYQKSDVLFATGNYFEIRGVLFKDLHSKIKETEMMNSRHLEAVHDARIDELKILEESYNAKILAERQNNKRLLEWKENIMNSNTQSIRDVKRTNLVEVQRLEAIYKNKLHGQVKLHCTVEKEWETASFEMNERKQKLLQTQEKEMHDFSLKAEKKMANQRSITRQLEIEKADLERQNKEMIAELEDDIDEEITRMKVKFDNEVKHEHDSSERLKTENGILSRKLESTRHVIDDFKQRVTSLLESEKEAEDKVKRKEADRERNVATKKSKNKEVASKDAAVNRLHDINKQLIKFRSVEEDKLQEAYIYQTGPRKKKKEQVEEQIRNKLQCLKQQQQSTSDIEQNIIHIQEVISDEKTKIAKMESHIRGHDALIQKFLIGLQNCRENIQNPVELRSLVKNMRQVFESRSSSKPKQETEQPSDDCTIDDKQAPFCLAQKHNELNCLQVEDSALNAKYRKARAGQVAINAYLLEIISNTKNGRRARRSYPKSIKQMDSTDGIAIGEDNTVIKNNTQHIKILEENKSRILANTK